eukprot:m.311562 g.311562  ORF g.311562 m.311562 type:complete len:351 (+) comp81595_c0_seq1:1-1053(+)
MEVSLQEALAASLLGSVAFPAALALQQSFLFGPLRLTSGHRLAAPILGFGAVWVAGTLASLSTVGFLKASAIYKTQATQNQTIAPSLKVEFRKSDLLLFGVSSTTVFFLFRGRFRAVLPSNLFQPGSFARESIAATKGVGYANQTEKEAINKLGKKYGCHSCGSRPSRFVADHQPPNALVKPGEAQRYFPQCSNCSNKQGGAIRSSAVGVVTHGLKLRFYHVWMPVPLLVGWMRSARWLSVGDEEVESVDWSKDSENKPGPVEAKEEMIVDEKALGDSLVTNRHHVNQSDSDGHLSETKEETKDDLMESPPSRHSHSPDNVAREDNGLIHTGLRIAAALSAIIYYFITNT